MLWFHLAIMLAVLAALPPAVARADEPLTEEAERAEEAAALRGDDAASLYVKAAKLIKTDSPAASVLEYPEYPPYGREWEYLAEASWTQNAPVFELVRRARGIDKATWPRGLTYLSRCRELANIIGDGAIFQHLRGNDHVAVETIRDLLHVTDLLRQDPSPNDLVRPLVTVGIDALCTHRLMTIASAIRLSDDPADPKALQTADARRLIKQLLDVPTAAASLKQVFGDNHDTLKSEPAAERVVEVMTRNVAERRLAAMSLACHLFRHETKRWPASIEELATKLPHLPLDPWGDGKQTLGYTLIKGGLPDGSDRPLVYGRWEASRGLFYRLDEPQYAFYHDDGTRRPIREQTRGGQFRDVTRWTPTPRPVDAPTVQPLNGL